MRIVFVALLVLGFPAGANASAPPKPIVIVFAGTPAPDTGAGVTATPTSSDGINDSQVRNKLAAREIRDRFNESNVAEAVLYAPDSPLFIRASIDAKLKMADPAVPSIEERLALAKAIGAISVVTISARSVKDKQGAVEVVLDAIDVATKKTYSDNSLASGGTLLAAHTSGNVSDNNPPVVHANSNTWMTVSNTLVVRYLAGPLGEYTRALAPDSLLPLPPKPTTDATTTVPNPASLPPVTVITPGQPTGATPPDTTLTPTASGTATPTEPTVVPTGTPGPHFTADVAAHEATITHQAQQSANALIASGDLNGAIVVLRHSINQAPRSLALRASLAKAYLAAGRTNDAMAEAKRALSVAAPDGDSDARLQMTKLMADAYTKSGDQTAARAAYNEILTAQPQAQWARVALADLLLKQGDTDGAENAYRTVLKAEPSNKDAALGLARVLMSRGNFNEALNTVSQGNSNSQDRLALFSTLFDDVSTRTADSVASNRTAFDNGQLTREVFYKAATAESARITSLLSLLQSTTPPASTSSDTVKSYKHRVFAATLLSQALDGMLAYLEKGDRDAGEQAKVNLEEFRKELAAAQSPQATTASSAPK